MKTKDLNHIRSELNIHSRLGYVVLGATLFFVFVWGGLSKLSGAVLAEGAVSVESSVKRIQHKEGGIVREILVKEGDLVRAGQVLVRLDNTVSNANEAVVEEQVVQLEARRLRLEAEREGRAGFELPTDLKSSAYAPVVMASERELMQSRTLLRMQRKGQIAEQMRRSSLEADALRSQVVAKSRQLVLINKELESLRKLNEQGYAPLTRVYQFERESESLSGQKGELEARIEQTEAQSAALRLQMLQVDSGALSDIMTELKETEVRLAQLRGQKIAAADSERRVEIKAPVDGKVQGLTIHTVGGVITPAETLMSVVPLQDALVIDARIDPRHVDQVRQGSLSHIRFTSFATQSTPEASGRVNSISADVQTEERTGRTYYRARINLDSRNLPAVIRENIVSGMPVEVQIETSRRTALSYFLKPLTDQFNRAFRED